MSLSAWRGPGPGRPILPLPPDPMPLLRGGRMRKRWRYVGVYGPQLMLCATRAEIGPLRQSFWVLWDRERRHRYAGIRWLRRGELKIEARGLRLRGNGVRAELDLGEAAPVEVVCPNGERGYSWTRKRAGVPVGGAVEAGGRRWQLEAEGIDDESAGYHQHHTCWRWSAGVGRAVDGRALAWNLVSGMNDPAQRSERAIWLDGVPQEPRPVSFAGLQSIGFADGARLDFASESDWRRDDNLLVLRSRYLHRFGTFSGSLAGIELGQGFGVMEEHEALW